MNYKIYVTKTAVHDLEDAADYIEFILKNPQAADDLLYLSEQKISKLSTFPEAHAIVDDPVLSSWGIRFTVVNNYLIFFKIIDETVYIIRFIYGKRDWIGILGKGISLE